VARRPEASAQQAAGGAPPTTAAEARALRARAAASASREAVAAKERARLCIFKRATGQAASATASAEAAADLAGSVPEETASRPEPAEAPVASAGDGQANSAAGDTAGGASASEPAAPGPDDGLVPMAGAHGVADEVVRRADAVAEERLEAMEESGVLMPSGEPAADVIEEATCAAASGATGDAAAAVDTREEEPSAERHPQNEEGKVGSPGGPVYRAGAAEVEVAAVFPGADIREEQAKLER